MTKAQHTPGPWRVIGNPYSDMARDVIAPNGNRIAALNGAAFDYSSEVAANARLIASAPDLLAALENLLQSDLVEWFPPSPNTGGKGDWTDELRAKGAPILAARAAIAKAKGIEQ